MSVDKDALQIDLYIDTRLKFKNLSFHYKGIY